MNYMAFAFPAIRGVQAGRDYYASMVPLEVIPRIFQFSDKTLSPEGWEQRLSVSEGINWENRNPAWDKLTFMNGKVAANRSTPRAMSSYMRSVMTGNAGGNDV